MIDDDELNNSIKDELEWLKAYEHYRVEGTKFIREWIVPKKNNSQDDKSIGNGFEEIEYKYEDGETVHILVKDKINDTSVHVEDIYGRGT